MPNNTQLNINDTSGDTIATEDILGVKHELVKLEFGADGVATKVSATDPLPITGDVNVDTSTLATSAKQDTGNTSLGSIDTKLTSQATAANQATEISALASILAKLSADPATQTTLAAILTKIIAAPATEAKQDTGNTSLASIDGKLTNPLPVSGTVTTGGLTDTQLRASAVPVSNTNLDVALSTRTKPADQQHAIIDSGTVTSITNNVNTVEVAPTTIYNGKTTVTTAGTRVTLASSQAVKGVTVKALVANTGLIYVGNSSVASTNGYQLSPGESVSMDLSNLNTVNLDSAVNGEGVTYIAVN